jgi:hypothetical protein
MPDIFPIPDQHWLQPSQRVFFLTFQKFHQKNKEGKKFEITTFNSMVLEVAKK